MQPTTPKERKVCQSCLEGLAEAEEPTKPAPKYYLYNQAGACVGGCDTREEAEQRVKFALTKGQKFEIREE